MKTAQALKIQNRIIKMFWIPKCPILAILSHFVPLLNWFLNETAFAPLHLNIF